MALNRPWASSVFRDLPTESTWQSAAGSRPGLHPSLSCIFLVERRFQVHLSLDLEVSEGFEVEKELIFEHLRPLK